MSECSPAFRDEIGTCFVFEKGLHVLKHIGVIDVNSLRGQFFVEALLSN